MDKQLIERIRNSKESPLIAVIGATNPKKDYKEKMGIETGYYLREFIDSRKGNIFTGGVDGVGVDVYAGVMKYCINKIINKKANIIDDRFFVLIPSHLDLVSSHSFLNEISYESSPYYPPSSYEYFGILTSKGKLDKIVAGKDMNERREYLAMIADIIVVVNGGCGTIHEAIEGLKNNKPVINLFKTGGATKILKYISEDKSRNKHFNGIIKREDLNFNKDLLHQADSISNAVDIIKDLLN